jgi:hypothetical protein
MPADYECQQCLLYFNVGWYHYHTTDSGYWSCTLLVCTACGTVHALEHPAHRAKVPERLQSQAQPIFNPPKLFGGRAAHFDEWQDAGLTEGRQLTALACHHCHAVGTLCKEWPAGAGCPHCGKVIPKPLGVWMT